MSHIHFAASRAAIASAALLSLALLAGCESDSKGGSTGSAVASTDGTGDPIPTQSFGSELKRVGDRVHFALDRYDLSPDAEATLRQQATLLQNYPEIVVTVEGHADERGTREYNLARGERRADTVRNYPTALGIPAERISVISYGKERPECPESAEGCWSKNRRGVTVPSQ